MANLVRNLFKHQREYLRSSYRLMQSDSIKKGEDISTRRDNSDLPMREELTDVQDRRDTPAAPVVINLFEDAPKIKQRETPEILKEKPEIMRKDAGELSSKVESSSKEVQIEQSNERLERMLNDIKISLENMENQLKRSFLSHCQISRLKKMAVEAEREERIRRKLEIVVIGMNKLAADDDPTIKASEFIEMYFKLPNSVWSARLFGDEKQLMLIKLRNTDLKNKIMRDCSVLKGSGISVRPHLTLEQRILHQRLKTIGLEAQELGKTVKIGYSYLIIDGEKFIWNSKTSSLELKQY